jgi:hypothetical protein
VPAVVTWYQMPEDDAELLQFIERSGAFNVIPTRIAKNPSDVIETSVSEFMKNKSDTGCSIIVKGAVIRYGIAEYGAPVNRSYGLPWEAEKVLYDRAFPADNILHASNLCAYWSYLSEDKSTLIEKSPEFRKWANKLFAWVRRHTPERIEYSGYAYRATVRAAEAHRRGEFAAML